MEAAHPFRTRLNLRWADIDANFHLRHSVYYDVCAQQRVDVLATAGITLAEMQRLHFGPVLFKETCTFRREIKLNDEVWLTVALKHLSQDHRKFAFEHVFTNVAGDVLAQLSVEGAWMDTVARKIAAPPLKATEVIDQLPRTADFVWI